MEHIYSCKIFNVNKEKNEYEKIYGEDVKTKYRVFKSKWYKFWGLFTVKWVYTFIMKYILVTSEHRQII